MEINWRNIAEMAYESYSNSMSNHDNNGKPLLQWDKLPEFAKIAWENAARTSCDVFGRAVTA